MIFPSPLCLSAGVWAALSPSLAPLLSEPRAPPDRDYSLSRFLGAFGFSLACGLRVGGPLLFPSSLLASRHFASLDPRRGRFHGSWGFVLRAPALGFVLPLGLLFAARLYGAPWLS